MRSPPYTCFAACLYGLFVLSFQSGETVAANEFDFYDRIWTPQSGPASAAWLKLRTLPRYNCSGRARICLRPVHREHAVGVADQPVLIRDLSQSGARLLTVEQLYPTQLMDLEVGRVRIAAEVQWCRRLRHRCYVVGCRFLGMDRQGPHGAGGEQAEASPRTISRESAHAG